MTEPNRTEPNRKLLADPDVQRIKLDGVDWPIPPLAMAQFKIIAPLLLSMQSKGRQAALAAAEKIDDLGTLIFTALQRGHADITRAEVDQMSIDSDSLFDAVSVIAEVINGRKRGAPPLVQAAPPASTETSSPTGTP